MTHTTEEELNEATYPCGAGAALGCSGWGSEGRVVQSGGNGGAAVMSPPLVVSDRPVGRSKSPRSTLIRGFAVGGGGETLPGAGCIAACRGAQQTEQKRGSEAYISQNDNQHHRSTPCRVPSDLS